MISWQRPQRRARDGTRSVHSALSAKSRAHSATQCHTQARAYLRVQHTCANLRGRLVPSADRVAFGSSSMATRTKDATSFSSSAGWTYLRATTPDTAHAVGRSCRHTHTHSSTPPTHHRQCRRARQPPIPCLSLYRSTIATSPTPPAQHSHTTVMTRTCWQRPQATHLLQGHRATAVCKGVEQLAHETSKPGRGNPQAVSLGATGGGEGEGDHTHRRTWLARPQARC